MGRPRRRNYARARPATPDRSAVLATSVAAAVLAGVLPLVPAAAAPAAATTPLLVELDDVVPGQIPRTGRIEVTGSVTNADDVPWSNVRVYTFLGSDRIDDVAELQQAALVGEDLPVGDRILDEGTYAEIDELDPGGSASFSVTVPSQLLLEQAAAGGTEPEPGVYWFGVHALGASPEGRDGFTDGRARTFLPLLPEDPRPVPLSLVVPLRTPVSYDPDGSVSDVARWSEELGPGGSLRDRLDFGAAAGPGTISWLVDPAVVDAVAQLAAGNPARSLAATGAVPDSGEDQGGGGGRPGTTPPDTGGAATAEAAERATAWLEMFRTATVGDELLTLPYGDVDVAGTLEHRPDAYLAARERPGTALRSLVGGDGPDGVAVVAPPDGHLTPAEIRALRRIDPAALLLGQDTMIEGIAPSLATVGEQPVVLASAGAAAGGPGPTEPLSSLALRQRILGEAALRLVAADDAAAALAAGTTATAGTTTGAPGRLTPDALPGRGIEETTAATADSTVAPEPLVVVMPDEWEARAGGSFFAGLRDAGVTLTRLAGAVDQQGVSLAPQEIAAPPEDTANPLGAGVFDAATALRRSGATLQNLLTRNSEIGSVVAGEALTVLGYQSRARPAVARAGARASQEWIRDRLRAVTIDAPPGVTLSGGTGTFSATVVNGLSEPVTVGIEAVVEGGIAVRTPDPVEIGPDSRSTVLIEVADTEPGVHDVDLRVIDVDGRPLPAADSVPIRSAQVSNVIWVIIAVGVGLLFAAIALRALRRLRGRGAAAGTADGAAS